MKRRFLLILFSAFTTYLCAESITIKQKSGNETVFELSTNPVITFSGENMVVTSEVITIMFPIDDIDCYEVGNAASGIQALTDAPQYHDGHMIFRNVSNGFSASVFSIDGKKIGQYCPSSDGILDISIGSFPKGTCIISTPLKNIRWARPRPLPPY